MKKKNKIIALSLSTFVIFSPIVLNACASYTSFTTNVNESPDSNISRDFQKINHNFVSDSIKKSIDVDFNEYNSVFSNQQKISQSTLDYLKTGDFSNFLGNFENLENDILIYFYEMFSNNINVSLKNDSVYNIAFKNLFKTTVEQKNGDDDKNTTSVEKEFIKFNETSVSFIAKTNINSKQKTKIVIANQEFDLDQDETQELTIKVNNQVFLPKINSFVNNFFLGWKFNEVEYSFKNKTWKSSFSFSDVRFSHIFKYSFQNLVNSKYTYDDLKQKYEADTFNFKSKHFDNEILDKESVIKQKIKDDAEKDLKTKLLYAELANSLLNQLSQKQSTKKLIQNVAPIVVDLLININFLPSTTKEIVIQALGNDIEKPFIEVLNDYKPKIIDVLKLFIGQLTDVVSPILSNFTPNLTESSEEYKAILSLIDSYKSDELEELVKNDLLGINKKPKPLLDIIIDNTNTLLRLASDNNLFNNLSPLLTLIFKKDSKNNFVNFYDSILSSKQNKKIIIDAVTSILPLNDGIKKIINSGFVENDSLNQDSVLTFFKSIFDFTNVFLERNPYSNSFFNRYKNLDIISGFSQENKFKYDVENKTISFEYLFFFKLKKDIVLNLKSLKDIVSPNFFISLLSEFNVNGLPDKNLIELTRLQELLFKFIPDEIRITRDIETSRSFSIFRYFAKDKPITFVPILHDGKYFGGVNIPIDIRILNYYQSGIDEVTKQYKKHGNLNENLIDNNIKNSPISKTLSKLNLAGNFSLSQLNMDLYYSSFWKELIQSILSAEYSYSTRLNLINEDVILAEEKDYIPNVFTNNHLLSEQFDLNKLNKVELAQILDPNNKDNYFTNNPYYINWQNNDQDVLITKNPIINDKVMDFIKKTIDPNKELNDNYQLNANLIVNANLPIKIKVHKNAIIANEINLEMNLRLMIIELNIYSPFAFYYSKTKKLTNKINKLIFHFQLDQKK